MVPRGTLVAPLMSRGREEPRSTGTERLVPDIGVERSGRRLIVEVETVGDRCILDSRLRGNDGWGLPGVVVVMMALGWPL